MPSRLLTHRHVRLVVQRKLLGAGLHDLALYSLRLELGQRSLGQES